MIRLLWLFPIVWALLAVWIVAAFLYAWWCDARTRHEDMPESIGGLWEVTKFGDTKRSYINYGDGEWDAGQDDDW